MTSIKFRALTHDDHKLFFEALGEHGKDFQNIQQYMAQKCGKGNNTKSSEQNKSIDPQERREQDKKEEDKKRDQIRNFYNKLYAKLSQLIGKLDDRVEKVIQELYLLVNYGEIWKRLGFKFDNKTKKLLEELVHQGYTTLRFKNKNVRLRTPPCKALKKINEIGIDEKVKVVTSRELPKDVIVEFHPSTNRDWLKVQSMAQNPLVRAKLSIQKRMFNILEFLENKWNISQDKLNRTVDAWLKVPPNNQSVEEIQPQLCQSNTNALNSGFNNGNYNSRTEAQNVPDLSNVASEPNQASPISDTHFRLRLKPSSRHELKEVNITRVVPDNHLDLSFNAYIKRFGESISKSCEASGKNNVTKDQSIHFSHGALEDGLNISDQNYDQSHFAPSTSSRLPLSLTTPDSSILLEKSCTSDQPYNATAQKSINFLAKLVGSFGGCENSRTACEDTQDRSLHTPAQFNENSRSNNAGSRSVYFTNVDSIRASNVNSLVNNSISALLDEDAAIEPALSATKIQSDQLTSDILIKHNSDSQNSKSVDFNIPKNVLLGDWLKMSGQDGGDDANDAFPPNQSDEDNKEIVETQSDNKEYVCDNPANKVDPCTNGIRPKSQNHMIEIEKLAEGWTRQDESSMTIGELYLAFKCPEKIILEYEFEQFTYSTLTDQIKNDCSDKVLDKSDQLIIGTTTVPESPSNNTLIFKLLTAASLSLAQIERQKQEQQHKLQEQPTAKLKRRKGPSNPNTIKYLKRDDAPINKYLNTSASGQESEAHASNHNRVVNNHPLYNNNYISTSNDKSQGQAMTLHDIETTNQRVEEALKQLQPTRLCVFRRAR